MLNAIAAWQIWRLPRRAVPVVITVELIAALLPWTCSTSTTVSDVGNAVLLASLSIAYAGFTATWERVRRLITQTRSPNACVDLLAIWTFPAAMMLPSPLAALVIAVTAAADWRVRRSAGQSLHRYVYSSAVVLLAAAAAGAVRALPLPLVSTLLVAGVTYSVVEMTMVALIITVAGQYSSLKAFLVPRSQLIEITSVSLGIVLVLANRQHIPLIWLSLPAAIGIQWWARKDTLREIDDSTAPLDQQVWLHIARVLVSGCELAALIRIDTQDSAAVRAMAQLQSGCDIIGDIGDGSGLAILLADCPAPHANALASRLRAAVAAAGVTAHVAVAAKPSDGDCLEDLLVVAEAELIATGAGTDAQNQHRLG